MSKTTKKAISVTVLGAGGRMGTALIRALSDDGRFALVGAVVSRDSEVLGRDAGTLSGAGENGITIGTQFPTSDVVIDFSSAEALQETLPAIESTGAALVTGTTGLSSEQQAQLDRSSQSIPILTAANMSLGVQAMYQLVEQAARSLGRAADIDILEAHHKHKQDAPSGTALALGQVVAEARGQDFSQVARLGRQGAHAAREPGEIGFAAVRAGDIVGEHTVLLGLNGERLEITHRAASRDAFVNGALAAAAWLAGKTAGRYQIADVLGEAAAESASPVS